MKSIPGIEDKEIEIEIRRLGRQERIISFFQKNQLLVLNDLFFDYSVIFLSILFSLRFENYLVYIISVLIIASRMRALENLLHEASHFNLFKKKKINDFVSFVFCALPLFSSIITYRESHLKHHKFLGNPERDPDLIRYGHLGIDKLPFSKTKIIFHFLKIFSLLHVIGFLKSSLNLFIYSKGINTKKEVIVRIIVYCFLACLFFYLKLTSVLFFYWIIPYLTFFQIIKYLGEISEHGGLYYKSQNTVFLTRNSLCSPFFRFFIYPHNDNYHLIHHIFPSINYHSMPKMHKFLMKESDNYRKAHHCYGYFYTNQGISTINEMTK